MVLKRGKKVQATKGGLKSVKDWETIDIKDFYTHTSLIESENVIFCVSLIQIKTIDARDLIL